MYFRKKAYTILVIIEFKNFTPRELFLARIIFPLMLTNFHVRINGADFQRNKIPFCCEQIEMESGDETL